MPFAIVRMLLSYGTDLSLGNIGTGSSQLLGNNGFVQTAHGKQSLFPPDWNQIFAVGCWMLWSWRNRKCHDDNFQYHPRPHVEVLNFVKGCNSPRSAFDGWPIDLPSGWQPPTPAWCKLNTDGSWRTPDIGGCGGLIRGNQGEWIKGFSLAPSTFSPVEAEAIAAHEGLVLCWNLGLPANNKNVT